VKPTDSSQKQNLEQARRLARELYDYKLSKLENLPDDERRQLKARFSDLSAAQFDDVREQVIVAKHEERARVGWQSIPHDLAVIVLVLATAFGDLRTGLIAGVAALVFLESLFMRFFDRHLYPALSLAVWLTYPSYALLAYILHRRGYEILEIAGIVVFAWPGLFLLGALARIPLQLLWQERGKQRQSPPK